MVILIPQSRVLEVVWSGQEWSLIPQSRHKLGSAAPYANREANAIFRSGWFRLCPTIPLIVEVSMQADQFLISIQQSIPYKSALRPRILLLLACMPLILYSYWILCVTPAPSYWGPRMAKWWSGAQRLAVWDFIAIYKTWIIYHRWLRYRWHVAWNGGQETCGCDRVCASVADGSGVCRNFGSLHSGETERCPDETKFPHSSTCHSHGSNTRRCENVFHLSFCDLINRVQCRKINNYFCFK